MKRVRESRTYIQSPYAINGQDEGDILFRRIYEIDEVITCDTSFDLCLAGNKVWRQTMFQILCEQTQGRDQTSFDFTSNHYRTW